MDTPIDRRLGAIVSKSADQPLLFGERSDPVEEMDSGWQFSSMPSGGGEQEAAEIWTLEAILKDDPSLSFFVGMPPGTMIRRASNIDRWSIAINDSDGQ
ncbi:hypothetical protein [Rhizorhabdus argentea]|uniref:hypothetical protein n=1 Tax=Rhizorhabdus argentea TaxID=1387174 RepID=UPI0030EE97CD